MRHYGHGKRLTAARISRSYRECHAGTFGRMFPGLSRQRRCVLPINQQMHDRLQDLGAEIGAKTGGAGADNPAIAAGYTYWGQFIDHDITFDPLSTLDSRQRPRETTNFRTPRLDLDSVYGNGPSIDPFLYDQSAAGAAAGYRQPNRRGGLLSDAGPTRSHT